MARPGGVAEARGRAGAEEVAGGAPAGRAWLGGAMVLGAAALWGTLGIFARYLYAYDIPPLELASVRATVGFLGLGLWMLARPSRLRIRVRDLPFFAVYGLVSIALFHFLYFATLERTTVAVAVALLYTAPAFVVLLTAVRGGEAIRRPQWLALALVLGGVFLVTGAARLLATHQATISRPAVALGLGSGLAYGLYTLFGKRALRRYDSTQTVFYAFAFGALFLAAAAPPWRPVVANPGALPLLLAMGVLPTLAAYLLYIGGLRFLPASTASMLASAEPVVATVLGVLVLGEAMAADQAVGIALIVGAATMLSLPSRRSRAPAPLASKPTPDTLP